MTRQEICALVALAASSNPIMQAKDPAPIVAAWALMLSDLDPVIAKAAVIKVCRESDFFPSVAFRRVRGVFHRLGYSPAAATILALLCTESPRQQAEYDGKQYWVAAGERALPQGACTSPALSMMSARTRCPIPGASMLDSCVL